MSHGQQSDRTPPSPDEVRAALNRMIESELFRSSPQLASFLRFVVEAVLRGEAKRIKGYTIGIEALGRGPGFNPQVDPIVRVEATRLRRTMERYYAGPGVNDPIIIGLLRGSYVPTFRRRGARGAARAPGATSSPTTPRARILRFTLICFAAALALGAIAYTAVEWWNHVENPPTSSSTPVVAPGRDPLAGAVRSGNGMPTIGVQPFETIGTPQTQHISSETLQEKVHDALSLFDTINIEFEPPRGRTPAAHRGQTSLDYRLFGTIEHRNDGSVEVRFRLLDTADGKSVWSRTFEPFPAAEDREAIMERIIFHLATTLMQPYGVVRAHERIKYLSSSAGDPRNRCVVETLEALRSFIPTEFNDARACLERLTAMDQSFSIGFGYLSAVYIFRYQLGRDERPDDRALLDQALLVARRAVEIDPESSLAHQLLFNALFVRGEIAAAFAAADKAIALNKYNLFTQILYGGRLVMAGEVERGMQKLQQSAEYGSVLTPWHHLFLFLGHYLRGNLTEATYHADQATGADIQLGHIARALTAAAANDRERARQALARLVATNPAWGSQPRRELERFFPSAVIVDRLERDLAAAGLAAAANPKE